MYLIPLPSKITAQDGLFSIDHNTAIVLDVAQDDNDLETAKLLQQEIKKVIAITLPIKKVLRSAGNLNENCIYFQYDTMDSEKEAYQLNVRSNKITIAACSNRGFLYGAATLIQLCKISRGEISCVDIVDERSYSNRVATFGHLYDLLHSVGFGKYREMGTARGETFTWYNRMRYSIMNVSDPESFILIKGILDQYLPLFRSNKINICCDETFDLGKGKSASMAEKMDYGEMYLFYVNQLVEYLQSLGKEVMIWGDIVKSHPKHLDKLNAQVTCLNWYYDYGATEEVVKIFSDIGLKQYVCPSVSGYSRLVNAYDLSFTNIKRNGEIRSSISC